MDVTSTERERPSHDIVIDGCRVEDANQVLSTFDGCPQRSRDIGVVRKEAAEARVKVAAHVQTAEGARRAIEKVLHGFG
jgi:hypothetical protein